MTLKSDSKYFHLGSVAAAVTSKTALAADMVKIVGEYLSKMLHKLLIILKKAFVINLMWFKVELINCFAFMMENFGQTFSQSSVVKQWEILSRKGRSSSFWNHRS